MEVEEEIQANPNTDSTASKSSSKSIGGWQQSSRIIRVSRASGGKDRHSKVWTSKGLRDRRVRLSVTTAIQFYDLQDRLGYDQPSKAFEWLINAASDAISELPSLDSFPTHDHNTSKASGDVPLKARERPAAAAAKDKPIPPNSSFTHLLTSGDNASSTPPQLDYFSAGLNLSTPSRPHHVTTIISPAADFPFAAEQQLMPAAGGGADFGQSFWIGGGAAGFNRGTLQSNSSLFHHTHHLHRFSSSAASGGNNIDAANNIPFFFAPADHQHQFSAAGYSDHKGKGKN